MKDNVVLHGTATSDKIFRGIMFAVMAFFSVTYIVVIIWMMLNSFRSAGSYHSNPFGLFDFKNYTVGNYSTAFTYQVGRSRDTVFVAIGNSFTLMIPPLLWGMVVPAITGFVFSKFTFPLKNFLLNAIIITMTLPSISATTSTYKFINDIGLYDEFWGVWLMSAGGLGFGTLMYRNFFASIPWEYAESAYLDGAGNFTIFFKIYLPLAKPLITATLITGVIGFWNDFNTPYLYLPSHPTLAVFIETINNVFVSNGADYPKIFAVMFSSCAFTLIIYAIFNKIITQNMSAGGLKG